MEFLDQNLDDTPGTGNGIEVTRSMRQSWYTVSRWAKFLAVLSFVALGLMLLIVSRLSAMLPMMAYAMGENPVLSALSSMGAVFIGILLLMLAFQFLINYWQFRFAVQMQRAITGTDQESFVAAWMHFRNFFRAIGIVTAVAMALTIGFAAFVYTINQ